MNFLDNLKEKNIIEYILYMFQVENIVRQFNFDFEKISEILIDNNLDEKSSIEYSDFLRKVIKQMKNEKIEQNGHLSDLNDILVELSYLHNTLLNLSQDNKYKTLYNNSVEHIEDFRQKSNLKNKNQIELMIHALFIKWLMNLQKKELNEETNESMENFRLVLVHLGKSYHLMKKGELNFFNN